MQPRTGDEEEEEERLPFQGIDKATVLQETREFSAVTVNVSKCSATLSRILFLLATGETFTAMEATEVFFAATKLFQCDNTKLRRLMFVLLKELSNVAEQVFIASSSLVKDINSSNDVYKCHAIRALRKVTDSTMIGPMERYLKQAVCDKDNNVVSAALVTGIHLSRDQPEMVKRWGSEVSEALKTRGNKVQYHALALLHKLRKNDRLSVIKLVQGAQQGPIRAPLALCLLIKLSTELMSEDFASSQELYTFVASCLRHTNEIVVFEAAKALCSLRNISTKEITPAVLVLQLYLTSHKPTLRFAAVRLLNRVATNHPAAVTTCNIDLEALISDSNRNIATLAITALLKTGSEFSMERLMKQISSFMCDLNDEFKSVVVDSMKVICLKFPQKNAAVLQFLSDALHEEGGPDYKRAIVETIVSIINSVPAAKDTGLLHLCEFIEDCEFNLLTQRVLYLLGQQGPSTAEPKKYIRYINNRIALEVPVVRATAVTTLAKFAATVPELRTSILVLLRNTMHDGDDEVRDRATLYFNMFSRGDEAAIQALIMDVASAVQKERADVPQVATASAVDAAAPELEPQAMSDSPDAASQASSALLQMRDKLRKIPQLKELGEPFKTCEGLALTEPDTEYVVTLYKHVYAEHIVCQFKVQNTLEDYALQRVSVKMDVSEFEDLEAKFAIPIEKLLPGQTECAYVVFAKEELGFPVGTASCSFSFEMNEIDKATGEIDPMGDSDEYPIDDVAINMCDFIIPCETADFEKQWTGAGPDETQDTYSLSSMRNLTMAMNEFVDFYGMFVEGGKPEKVSTKSIVLNMAGYINSPGRPLLLISGKVFLSTANVVTLTLTLRGADSEIREYFSAALVS